MKFINLTVLRLAGSMTAGIVAAYFSSEIQRPITFAPIFLIILGFIPLLLLLIWLWERRKLQQGIFFGILTYSCFFILGYSNYQLRKPEYQNKHYSHLSHSNNSQFIQLKITEILSENSYNHKYEAEMLQLDSQQVTGKVLLSIKKDSGTQNLTVDTKLLISDILVEIPEPLNPHQFNYKKYLKTQGIHYQVKTSKEHFLATNQGHSSLKGVSERIRNHIIQKLSKTSIEPKQRAILQALVLGYKKDIDPEQYHQFAAAGVLHILAVSGLHVGILFLIFSRLFSPLRHLKFGKQIQSILVILFLWCFAILAGLSPSVVRAVTMFSFFAFANMLDRPTNGFNSLFLSYFVLLIFEPNWLFHVGFQLSYLAVFFILWVQPSLYKLYIPKFYLGRLFWGIITVTIAAQLGVAPLSLYYFHQFPGLFFISNLVILPFLSVVLIGGLLIVTLATFELLPQTIAIAYNWMLTQLNNFIAWVAQKEAFIFKEISFSFSTMGSCYFFLIMLLILWNKRKPKQLVFVLASISLWLGVILFENKGVENEQLVIFHTFGKTRIGYQNGRDLILYKSGTLPSFSEYPLKNFIVERRVSNYTSAKLSNVFNYKNRLILRLDSLGIYPITGKPIVLLTHSSKVNLDRLIDSLHPTLIVADGSNYPSFIRRWKNTCKARDIPFHYTGEKGAIVF